MSGEWGLEEWGLGPWGLGGGGGSLAIAASFIDSERTLQLRFTLPPLAESAIGKGDALNPLNWTIYRQQDGFRFTVLAVRQLDSITFQPFTLQKFGDYGTPHVVDVGQITDASFIPVLPPTSLTLSGCAAYSAARTSVGTVDISNVPVSGAATLAGTIKTTSSGDYATEGGLALLKKLIYRRLTTSTGSFFYLPNYGLGIQQKQLYGPAGLSALKVSIEKQVQIEPEVATCSAVLTLDVVNNILLIQLAVKLRNQNQEIPLSIPVKVV